jgi:hypothetical protein
MCDLKKFQRRKPQCLAALMPVHGVLGYRVLGQLSLRCVTLQMLKILQTSFQIKVRRWSCELPPKALNFSLYNLNNVLSSNALN